MKISILICRYFLAILLILGALGHIFTPESSDGLIADSFPKGFIHLIAIVVELSIGLLLLTRKFLKLGAFLCFTLMILFLPIHVIDAFKPSPVIGSPTVAYIRIAIQFLLIGMSWLVYKHSKQYV